MPLSTKSTAILSLIAEGYSYSQIVDGHPGIKYPDIFAAAQEALDLAQPKDSYQERLAEIRSRYPRAYEPWSEAEDQDLTKMHREGVDAKEMASRLQRQPSAVKSRLKRLGLA